VFRMPSNAAPAEGRSGGNTGMATGSHHAEITKQCRGAHRNQRIRPSEYTRVAAGMVHAGGSDDSAQYAVENAPD
jgi:hypothetical protein